MLKSMLSKLLSLWTGRLLILFLVGAMAISSVYVGSFTMKALFKPGPLSAMSADGETLGGYSSHAEFEKECGHCHAPIHCLTASRCQDCHYEIAKERSEAVGLHGALPGTARCQTCHVEHRGPDAVISEVRLQNIDHDVLTGFDLDRHLVNYDGVDLACADCHAGHYAREGVDCSTCHQDHDAQFLLEHTDDYGDDCLGCHDGRDRMANFEHDAVFALDGAHYDSECEGCHIEHIFAGTPSDCSSCHEDPELHAGIFGFDCARCHSAVAWAPTQFIQHAFIQEHVGDNVVACEHCHVDTYIEYPCFSCHERDEMWTVHLQWDIEAAENCIDCHPTGREGTGEEIATVKLLGTASAND